MKMEPKATKQKKPRRRFTEEFKAGAVALVLKEKKLVATVASDLGLSTSVVHSWAKQAKADSGRGPPGAMTTSTDQVQPARRRTARTSASSRSSLAMNTSSSSKAPSGTST